MLLRRIAKSRTFSFGKRQLQRPMKPQPINALAPLRDGETCSEKLW
jgi:hypothetical protein